MRLHQSNQGHSMACLLKAKFHYWHPPLFSCQLQVNIHKWWHVVRRKKDGPTINIKRPHQHSFMTHSQLMKIIKGTYNWRSTNTASSASCPELHTDKLTVRVVWEQTFLIKKMIYISILWIFHVFQLHLHIDSQLKGYSSISVKTCLTTYMRQKWSRLVLVHCFIALFLACILMIGLYIFTNNIQWNINLRLVRLFKAVSSRASCIVDMLRFTFNKIYDH
jgi:hypothetical protein